MTNVFRIEFQNIMGDTGTHKFLFNYYAANIAKVVALAFNYLNISASYQKYNGRQLKT